ncbi:MAG: mechanosensitive ion channel [Candidatus Altiarchaeota archaeon]|nr:mechanosensitive ion channel [Candidatus Altiarchaeota archaeon]
MDSWWRRFNPAEVEGLAYQAAEKIIILALIAVSACLIIRIINYLFGRFFDFTKMDDTLERFIHKTTIMLLWLVTFGMVLIYMGVDVNAVVAGFGVGSFIIGFALKDTLSNFASGIMILLSHPFRLGDDVNASGKRGMVRGINMSNTVLEDENGNKITLPNSRV